jgi:hypothetical protein
MDSFPNIQQVGCALILTKMAGSCFLANVKSHNKANQIFEQKDGLLAISRLYHLDIS